MSLALCAYRGLTGALEPLAPALLERRARAGKEEPARLGERLGRATRPRPPGAVAWLHGASVGESLSLLPLIGGLRAARPDLGLVVTSGTVASAEMMQKRLPEGVLHQYAPIDAPAAARRFIAHWRPSLAVFVESELWPNLILEAEASGARLALLSARLSQDSLRGWRRAPAAARRLLGAFSLVQAQDEATAGGLSALGARDDGRLNLKAAADALPTDDLRLAGTRGLAGDRPVLLAASTHPGEEELALDAFAVLAGRPDRPLLVLAPRHPLRGPAAATLAESRGFSVRRAGAGQDFDGDAAVHVADVLGEMGLWLRLARAVLVAGSLVPGVGGHNPLEAAMLGCPIISGRMTDNWRSVYAGLSADGLVAWVEDAASLAAAFAAVLDDPAAAAGRAARAHAHADGQRGQAEGAVRRLLELIAP